MIKSFSALIFFTTAAEASQYIPQDQAPSKPRPLVRGIETRDLLGLSEKLASANMNLSDLCREANTLGLFGTQFTPPKTDEINYHHPIGSSPILRAMGVVVSPRQK